MYSPLLAGIALAALSLLGFLYSRAVTAAIASLSVLGLFQILSSDIAGLSVTIPEGLLYASVPGLLASTAYRGTFSLPSHSRTYVTLCIILAGALLLGALFSTHTAESIKGFLGVAQWVALSVFCLLYLRPRDVKWIVLTWTLVCLVYYLPYLYIKWTIGLEISYELVSGPGMTFRENPIFALNKVSAFALVCVLFALYSVSIRNEVISFSLGLLIIAFGVLSGSRAFVLVLVVISIALAADYLTGRKKEMAHAFSSFSLGALALLGTSVLFVGAEEVVQRIANDPRSYIYSWSISHLDKSLLLGFGPSTMSTAFLETAGPDIPSRIKRVGISGGAHNTIFQVLHAGGIVACLTYLGIWFYVFKSSLRSTLDFHHQKLRIPLLLVSSLSVFGFSLFYNSLATSWFWVFISFPFISIRCKR